jgi:nicotinamidase-related amidase
MKNKIFSFSLIILFTIISVDSFSQDKKEQRTLIKPALLVIDIQNAYLQMMPESDKEMAMLYINNYIELFRSHGFPIIRIYHLSNEYGVLPGTDQFEFPTSILIKPEDSKVIKTYPDGFNKTDLDKVIKEKGCNTLFLCGLSATGCVLATWIGAQDYDYKAFLIKDAIMSPNSEYTNSIEEIFEAVSYDVVKLVLDNSEK